MKQQTKNLLAKLANAEHAFFSGDNLFFSPALPGESIRVRIENIILTLSVIPPSYEGWGVFKPTSRKTAEFVREASLSEREEYLKLFPRFRVVVYHQGKNKTLAYASNATAKGIILNGIVRVLLPEDISLFDVINVRWDGQNLWYDGPSAQAELSVKDRLIEALAAKTPPDKLQVPKAQPDEIQAYAFAYENVKDKAKDRIESALRRSGAGKLINYIDRGASYTVTYMVNNQQVTSTLDSENLRVQSAGICLSGGDKNYDLQTLVPIIKEGQTRGRIVVGDYSNYGYHGPDDDYYE